MHDRSGRERCKRGVERLASGKGISIRHGPGDTSCIHLAVSVRHSRGRRRCRGGAREDGYSVAVLLSHENLVGTVSNTYPQEMGMVRGMKTYPRGMGGMKREAMWQSTRSKTGQRVLRRAFHVCTLCACARLLQGDAVRRVELGHWVACAAHFSQPLHRVGGEHEHGVGCCIGYIE